MSVGSFFFWLYECDADFLCWWFCQFAKFNVNDERICYSYFPNDNTNPFHSLDIKIFNQTIWLSIYISSVCVCLFIRIDNSMFAFCILTFKEIVMKFPYYFLEVCSVNFISLFIQVHNFRTNYFYNFLNKTLQKFISDAILHFKIAKDQRTFVLYVHFAKLQLTTVSTIYNASFCRYT